MMKIKKQVMQTNRILLELAQAIRHSSDLPKKLWYRVKRLVKIVFEVLSELLDLYNHQIICMTTHKVNDYSGYNNEKVRNIANLFLEKQGDFK